VEEETNVIVKEKQISIHEIIQAHREGRLIEIIGCSTSSHIQPINKLVYKDQVIQLNTNKDSYYCNYFNNLITDIMVGPDSHPWITSLKKP
jgi:branched-chain amino acid aminotransferase